jgi:hypothetical protein
MPTMAAITVKKADGTTDIIYNALNPSGGDDSAAFWRNTLGASPVVAGKPTLQLLSKWNAARDVRRVTGKFLYPYYTTDTTTGVTSVRKVISIEITAQIPQDCPSVDMQEAAAQGPNLFASTLIKSCFELGYAPQ